MWKILPTWLGVVLLKRFGAGNSVWHKFVLFSDFVFFFCVHLFITLIHQQNVKLRHWFAQHKYDQLNIYVDFFFSSGIGTSAERRAFYFHISPSSNDPYCCS